MPACLSFGITGIKTLLQQIKHAVMAFPWGRISVKGICNGGSAASWGGARNVSAGCQENLFVLLLSHRLPLGQGTAPHWPGLEKEARASQDAGLRGPRGRPCTLIHCMMQGAVRIRTCAQMPAGCHLKQFSIDPPHPCWSWGPGWRGEGGTLRHREGKEESEVSQQSGTNPWEQLRPLHLRTHPI